MNIYKFIPQPNKVGWRGVYWNHFVHLSVHPSICPSIRLSVGDMVYGALVKFALNFSLRFQVLIDCGHRQKPCDFQRRHCQIGCSAAILLFFCFQTLSSVWF